MKSTFLLYIDRNQRDKIGQLFKVLGDNFLPQKVTQMYCGLLGYLQKHHFRVKPAVATFWPTFAIFWATFYFSIRSHRL